MSRFNLIDEKWIPVRYHDGSRGELGIHDTLLHAKEIATIEDPSPLVVAALYRFLLAVLYRALEGPTDIDQAKALFRSGIPGDKVVAYLEKWRPRFWLFDEEYPFGQNPHVPKKEIEPWTKLTAEHNATSNKVLFDHIDTKNPGTRGPSECARWLLTTMSFSLSGGRGYYPSPSVNAMMCIPLGRNLHETLCYNLVPENRDVIGTDTALWECEPALLPIATPKQMVAGYANLYTWPARMILLEEHVSGDVAVMRFVAGQGYDSTSNSTDPMQPYKVDRTNGRLPVQFREDRGTWRDFDSLMPDDTELAPLTIQNALRLAGGKTKLMPKSVLVLGLRYTPPNANVDFWRIERFALPKAMAGNRSIREDIRQLLAIAEETQKSLWQACRSYARDLLSRGEREPDKKDISGFVEQMPTSPWYWSVLESAFHEILREYSLERDPDDIRCLWLKAVRNALRQAWEQHSASVSTGDAWAIRALVKAETSVLRKLKELNTKILKLEPQEETT
ncbi:type I-E CRISPR-associated protein Cse1/CasA [Thiobacillus sp.]